MNLWRRDVKVSQRNLLISAFCFVSSVVASNGVAVDVTSRSKIRIVQIKIERKHIMVNCEYPLCRSCKAIQSIEFIIVKWLYAVPHTRSNLRLTNMKWFALSVSSDSRHTPKDSTSLTSLFVNPFKLPQ